MMRLAKHVLALMLCVVLCMSIVPTAWAHTQVMTAGDFCVYLMYVVNRRDSKYGSGGVYSVGQYDGTNIYFDCWGLGESIICTRGQIVINKDPSLNPWSLWDTSCGCGSRTGDWLKSQCQLSNDFSNIISGEWLFKDDSSGHCYHVGYYIGDGQVIESTPDGGNNTQISFIDSNGRCSGISGRGSSWAWTSHAKVPWIKYDAAPTYLDRCTWTPCSDIIKITSRTYFKSLPCSNDTAKKYGYTSENVVNSALPLGTSLRKR